MNLLDLAVKITCDDQASGEVDKIGDGIKNKLGAAAKVGVAAVAAVGTATIAIGKTALDAYSNYEQLVGGIDTLFKASSGKMQQYAANAYQTAGVSANRYMEISTSFAAALISSLGGNTEAAADMANTAITDMSDNANKMGTSLETVQEAYMSLSRGNYEMLDSLKLGYGGTKSELERLLSDAEKFSAAQGKVRDFSVDSYSDIVEAIHIVQDEMGITGTTAEEAATTIEGSVNMVKASWENWLAGLGNENADMEVLTDQLVASVATAGENIIPRVGQIMVTLGQTVADYAPGVGLYLRNALINVLPESVQGPMRDTFSGIDDVIGKLAGMFEDNLEPAAGAAESIFAAIGSGVTTFGQAVNDLVLPAIDQLSPAFTYLFEAIQNAQPLLEFLADVFGTVLASAISVIIQLFAGLVEVVAIIINGFQQMYDGISGFVTGVVQFFTADLPNAINALIGWFAQLPGNIAAFLSMVISSVVAWVANMVANAVSAGSQFISGIAGFMSTLPGNVASWLSGAISTVVGWVSQFASNATSAASRFGSKLRSGLAAIPGTLGNIGANIVQGLVDGVTGAAGKLIDAVKGAVGDAIEGAKNLLGIHSPSRVFRKIGQYTMQGAALGVDDDADLLSKSTDNAMRGMISTAQDIKYMPDVSSVAATASVIEWLDRNLGDVIASRTPYIGMRDFDRLARKAVAHA
nr:MAG TPA: tail tape measure protein [Caudoviricetes sp.]